MGDLPKNVIPTLAESLVRNAAEFVDALELERTISRGLAEALVMALGGEPTDEEVEPVLVAAREHAREAIAKLQGAGG